MFELHIPSMTCGGCAKRVTQTIVDAFADAKVSVNMPAKSVQVQSYASEQEVTAALAAAGYPASLAA